MKRVAAALAVGLLLSGCASGPEEASFEPGRPDVDVDTPSLREMKQQAGVEPCPLTSAADAVSGGLPDVTLACFGGGPDVHLADLRGPMVVNLWASWCGPCRDEMPVLQAFHEAHADEVPVLGIDWQDPQTASGMELVVDTGVTYPLLADPAADLSVVDGMPVSALPGIVLVDADGTVAYRALEEIESEQELADLVEEHLGVEL